MAEVTAPESVLVNAGVSARGVRLDLTLPAGMTTAVVGPNGSGKTTLVQLVAGQLRAEDGQVRIGDEEVSGPSGHVDSHRRRISVLGQRSLLFPHLSVLENVAFGPRARGVRAAEAHARAQTELDAVGCGEFAARRPQQLSGGQAQRVAMARALAIDPRVLLLDEPLAALDASVAGRVRRLLAERLTGRTCLLVTHDVLDVWTLAQHVIVLDAGRVVATGTPDQVLGRPRTDFVAHLSGLCVLRGTASGPDSMTVGRVDQSPPRNGHPPASMPTSEGLGWMDQASHGPVVTGLTQDDWTGAGAALATFSPDAVALYPLTGADAPTGSPRNTWSATIRALEPRGPLVRVHLTLTGGHDIAADITAQAAAALDLTEGADIAASVKATQIHLHRA